MQKLDTTEVRQGATGQKLRYVLDVSLVPAVLATVGPFWPVQAIAAGLLPYLAWAGFAAALNFAAWRLNRTSPPAAPDGISDMQVNSGEKWCPQSDLNTRPLPYQGRVK